MSKETQVQESWLGRLLTCQRCGHGPWLCRITTKPKRCPNCSSQKWSEPRD